MKKEFDPDILDNADPEVLEFMADKFEKNYDDEIMDRIFDLAEEKYRIRMEKESSTVIPDAPVSRVSVSDNTGDVSGAESKKRSVLFEKKFVSAVFKTLSFAAALLIVAGAVRYGKGKLQRGTNKNEIIPGASVSDQSVLQDETDTNALNENKPERMLKTAVSSQTASKDDVIDLMMNTIDYFNQVSGRVYYGYSGGELFSSEFQCDIPAVSSFSRYTVYSSETPGDLSVVSSSAPKYEYHYYGDDESGMICKDTDRKVFKYDTMILPKYDTEYLQQQEQYKEKKYTERLDITNVYMSDTCLFPVKFALKFLYERESWNIEGTRICDGRECYIISGEGEEYVPELGIVSFEMLVDAGTGVLMRYEGFDEKHELKEFVYTENFRYDEKASPVRGVDIDTLEGYSYTDRFTGFEGELDEGLLLNVPFEIAKPEYYHNEENEYSLHNIPYMTIDRDKLFDSIAVDTDDAELLPLNDLFDAAEYAVAECTVLRKRYEYLDDGYPAAVYCLKVEKSMSGDLQEGDLIILEEFGGVINVNQYLKDHPSENESVKYKNLCEEERVNNYVYLYTSGTHEFRTGERLVAFLDSCSGNYDMFSLADNGTGVFRFKDNDTLERTNGSDYQEISYSEFIEIAGNKPDQ